MAELQADVDVPMSEEEEQMKAVLEQLAQEGYGEDGDDFVETEDPFAVLLGKDQVDERLINTGRYIDGKPEKVRVGFKDPGIPELAIEYLQAMQNDDAFIDLCRLVIAYPRWIVDDMPVRDADGNFIDENGEVVKTEADADRKPGFKMARTTFQVNLKHNMMRVCGVDGDFFEEFTRDRQARLAKAAKKLFEESRRPTRSGPPKSSETTPSPTDTPKTTSSPSSTPQISPSTSSSSDESSESPKLPKPSPTLARPPVRPVKSVKQ